MRHVNGVYTQAFNRRHRKVGHLFQGRFHAALVDADAYLLALVRYVELNPLRAGFVASPADWPWSSYRAHVGLAEPYPWLDIDVVQGHLLGRGVEGMSDRRTAVARYVALVASADDVNPWRDGLRGGAFLGDDAFVSRALALSTDYKAARGSGQGSGQ